jgi:hypothetical protein
LWLIGTFPVLKLNKDDYSAIKEYLEGYLPKIKQTGETFIDENGKKLKTRKKTGNKWFETHDQISYYKEFEKEKIVYNDISQQLAFSISKSGMYFNNTVYFISNSMNNKYLTSVLNTTTINWFYKRTSAQLGEKAVRLFSIYVKNLPIPKIPTQSQKSFETIVDYIITIKSSIHNSSLTINNYLEAVIDTMVYELYFEQELKQAIKTLTRFKANRRHNE